MTWLNIENDKRIAAMAGFLAMVIAPVVIAQSKMPPPTSREAIVNPSVFQRIDIAAPPVCAQSAEQCGRQVLDGLGPMAPGKLPTITPREETFAFPNDIVIFVYTTAGLPDDSIDGERYRVAYKRMAGALAFVQVGRQQRCARGDTKSWTKNACS